MAEEQGPIFIGGLAHSGKTPLRLMLAAHPHLALTRRTGMWDRYYQQFGDLTQPGNLNRCLQAMLDSPNIQLLQPDPAAIRHEFAQGAPTYARLFAIFHRQHAQRQGKQRWGEQLEFVERFADPIFAAFPTAKMIHLLRDPRTRQSIAAAHTRSRRGKIGWATARWIYSASLARRNSQRYPGGCKVVHYEALVCRPEEILREICAFIGEIFVPEMLAGGEETGGERETAVSLSTPEITFTQQYASQPMLANGYTMQPTTFSRRGRLLYACLDWPANRTSMVVWNTFRARSLAQHLEN